MVAATSFMSDNYVSGDRRSTPIGGKLDAQTLALPADIVAQLEADSLHGNLRRDSFRSRGGTKHFVVNPLFDDQGGDSSFV